MLLYNHEPQFPTLTSDPNTSTDTYLFEKNKGKGCEEDLNTTSVSTSLFGSKSHLFATNAITNF